MTMREALLEQIVKQVAMVRRMQSVHGKQTEPVIRARKREEAVLDKMLKQLADLK